MANYDDILNGLQDEIDEHTASKFEEDKPKSPDGVEIRIHVMPHQPDVEMKDGGEEPGMGEDTEEEEDTDSRLAKHLKGE